MIAFLVAGSPEAAPPAGLAPKAGDLVIAVDSGLLHARAWGWPVDLLIGDLDSLAAAGVSGWADTAPEVITAPVTKDETDLELALTVALERGAARIVICAALGGRPDHMLANIFLLARPELAGRDVVLVEGRQTLRVLAGGGELTVTGAVGDLLSLLPIGGPALGIKTDGVLYPLHDESLALGQPRGMSNVLAEPAAIISLAAGQLLVYHAPSATGQSRNRTYELPRTRTDG